MSTLGTAMPEPTLRGRLGANNGRGFKVMMITGGVLLALVFPVQAIAMFVLLTAAMTCIGVYNTVLSHHAMQKRRRRMLNHAVGDVTIGALGLGLVAAAVFPIPTMAAALCLAVLSGAVWGAAWIIEFVRVAETAPQQRTFAAEVRSRQLHPSMQSTRRAQNRERSSTRAAA
jgi:hypothetical protein